MALRAPVPQIEMALEARVEWTRMTHPFGAKQPPAQAEQAGMSWVEALRLHPNYRREGA